MKICLTLTKTQAEILNMGIQGITNEDLRSFGAYIAPMLAHHIDNVMIRLERKLEKKQEPGKKFKFSVNKAEAGAIMASFSIVEFNRSTESALLRGLLNEIGKHV